MIARKVLSTTFAFGVAWLALSAPVQPCVQADGCASQDTATSALLQSKTIKQSKSRSWDEETLENLEMALLAASMYQSKLTVAKNWEYASCEENDRNKDQDRSVCCQLHETQSDSDIRMTCGGWTMKEEHYGIINALITKEADYVGLFTKGDTCAMVFAGTNDWIDGVQDIRAAPTLGPYCGYTVHRGFKTEMRRISKSPLFPVLMERLESCSSVYSVGHSLGGAVASLFAACAGSENFGTQKVQKLYTFGAPGVTYWYKPIGNDGDCFGGARFFNYDLCVDKSGMTAANKLDCAFADLLNPFFGEAPKTAVDFVAVVGANILEHPKVKTVLLGREWSQQADKSLKSTIMTKAQQELTCEEKEATKAPRWTQGHMKLHHMGNYIERLRALQ